MAYENVEFPNANFCISPRTDEFCSINHSTGVMQIRTSAGAVQQTYNLSDSVNEIQSLEYAGPRDLTLSFSQLGSDLPFFTLEHLSDTQCRIRHWKLNSSGNTLDLQDTFTYTTISGANNFDCYTMGVENYQTSFDAATTTGTGRIQVVTTSGIEVGDNLLLGPSTDVDNSHAFETVQVSTISGGWVYITASGTTPPVYEYAEGNDITYWKSIYLFSDIGYGNDYSKGSLFEIDSVDGSVLDVQSNGIYADVRSASWSRSYQSVGFIKNMSLLYLNPTTYQVSRSHVSNLVEDDDKTVIPVYDIVFDDLSIFRLQRKITLVDDDGNRSTTSWSSYNYHQDSISPYTKSIVLYTYPDGIVLNDEPLTIYVVVRDQFGVGLSGKTVTFTDDLTNGYFTPLNGQVTTNINGAASITYTVGYFDPTSGGNDEEIININAETDGASSLTGSVYVNDNLNLKLKKKFTSENVEIISQIIDGAEVDTFLQQIEDVDIEMRIKTLSKFQFPGGHWQGGSSPGGSADSIIQLEDFESSQQLTELEPEIESESFLDQDEYETNEFQLSQLYISRHHSSGHKDDVEIDQFNFIEDAIPSFWSIKNSRETNISIRLRPFAFSLNQSTLVFKVRQLSYVGDTGYIDVTSSCVVNTFDAGGGLLGLYIVYDPPNPFNYNATIFVSIEVYDTAPAPNIILTDYWFKIIQDYGSPYIDNEDPAREEEDVDIGTNISFDVHDVGRGVDRSTLVLYINNRYVTPTTVSGISDGYHIEYNPPNDFYYGQTVEIGVSVDDKSDYSTKLYDRWRFYCEGSTGPWIDRSSFYPDNCSYGVPRKIHGISANVYAVDGTGVNSDSILFIVGGKERSVKKIPIIYRID